LKSYPEKKVKYMAEIYLDHNMLDELRGKLYSTVVGSFPYTLYKGLMHTDDWSRIADIRDTSFKALNFQLDCGIEFPSDGQFFDIIDMYREPLHASGFLNDDHSLGDGKPPKGHPITKLESELEGIVRKEGGLGLRVPITGPFTLSYGVKNGGKSLVESGEIDGVRRLGESVKAFCRDFDRSLKCSILTVDEPVLPFVLPTFGEEGIKEVLNEIFASIKRNHSSMHICGAIGKIKDVALSTEADILDHEFQGTDNSGVYTKKDLERNDKLLSYGLINTNPRQVFSKDGSILVESVADITSVLEDTCNIYGRENLLISPDCGFGGWKHLRRPEDEKWRYIKRKLCNMVQARNNFLVDINM
jgi:methionine synthase II (cobalamin-independent)